MSEQERAEYAIDSLRREAAARGATHVRIIEDPVPDPRDPMWVVVYGRAYRCTAGAASADAPATSGESETPGE